MPILREDAKDALISERSKAITISGYVKEGFTPESAAAVGRTMSLLRHRSFSVQLQPPGTDRAGTTAWTWHAALAAANGAGGQAMAASPSGTWPTETERAKYPIDTGARASAWSA
jgi:hypothetical protein